MHERILDVGQRCAFDDGILDGFEPVGAAAADDSVRAFWESLYPDWGSNAGVAVSLGGVRDENLLALRLDHHSQFDNAEEAAVQEFGGREEQLSDAICSGARGRGGVPQLPDPVARRDPASSRHLRVDETWYEEGVVRTAFCYIRDHAKNLRFDKPKLIGAAAGWRADAVEFFFGEESLTHITLNECCDAIHDSIRPDVIRLRLVYEMFQGLIVLPAFLTKCVPLPGVVRGRLLGDDRWLADLIAEQAWFEPGLRHPQLVRNTLASAQLHTRHRPEQAAVAAELAAMIEEGLIGQVLGHCYLIGRNPASELEERIRQHPGRENQSRSVASWSRLF